MKIRKLKKIKLLMMHHIVVAAYWQKKIDGLFKQMHDTPEEKARRDKAFEHLWTQLLKPVDEKTLAAPEPDPKHEYRVLRKSTGLLHKSYATLAEAQGAIDRAKRNRQAQLILA